MPAPLIPVIYLSIYCTCDIVCRRFIVVVVIVVVAGCSSESDVLAVDAIRRTKCEALEGRTAAAGATHTL